MRIDVQGLELRNGVRQGQIAQIHGDDIDCLGNGSCAHYSEIDAFEVHDPRIIS